MESYLVTVYGYSKKNGYDRVYPIWAKNIDNARRNLILDYSGKEVSIEVSKSSSTSTRFLGTLDIQGQRYNWQPQGKNAWYKVSAVTGALLTGKTGKTNYKKFTADGFPIYKIWKLLDGSYNVLAKNNSGEWVYGRNYNIKTGRWAGGTYRVHINDLYERCPPIGKLVVDNKRGPTGKY